MDAVGKLSGDSCRGRSSLIDRITGFEPPKKVYICALMLFLAFFGIVSYFHEPWLDEAQAWMIARDASYYDMFFVLTHYEGHPPLWWLILSVPAKLGIPYELSLSLVMIIISGITAYLIMFKSPFCGIVRLILPFTYYFFYQYGIIARPYGLLTLAMILAAIFYRQRNQKPFRYVLSLALLCAASAFGIIISGGLALVWCIEIIREYKFKELFTKFIRTRRFAALFVLLCIALFFVYVISSVDETFTNDTIPFSFGRFFRGVWYMLFMLPADCLLLGSGSGLNTLVKYQSFSVPDYITLSIPGILTVLMITELCRRRGKTLEFILTYSLMAIFGSVVYFGCHHEGIAAVFYIFIVWICCDEHEISRRTLLDRISEKEKILSEKNCLTVLVAVCMASQMIWSINAAVTDIKCDYFYGRAAAEYIKEHGFDDLNIMAGWYYEDDSYDHLTVSADKQHCAATIDPYFNENIFFNFNYGDKSKGYILHRLSEEANEEQYALWRNTVPDILVNEPHLELVYEGTDVKRSNYILIKTIEYNQIWKLNHASNFVCIYMRKDLFDDYPDIQPENPADYEFIYQ